MAVGLAGVLAIGGSIAAGEPVDVGAEAVSDHVEIPSTRRQVNVYWGWDMPTHPVSPERIAAGARMVDRGRPAANALKQLLEGPNAVEDDIGMITLIPEDTTLNGLTVDDGVATVDFSSEFVSFCGALANEMQLAQVVFTLTQFRRIDRVKFAIDGVPTDPIMCHGTEVGAGLDRNYFNTTVRPLVMVEDPYPGARVVNPLVVRGESNTFEATVRYILTDQGGDGRIIDEGFTTATAGSGTWGRYRIEIDLDSLPEYEPGPGAIIVWDEDTRDGSMGATVEYPIYLPPRCFGKAATILGTWGDDVVTGTDGADVIVTRSGDDVVRAGRGADRVCLRKGDDWVRSGRGRDTIDGGRGADELLGGRHADVVFGGRGADTLLGGPGPDVLRGGFGPDALSGGLGDDELFGGPGVDGCVMGPGTDTLHSCEMVITPPPPPPPVGS